MRGKVESDSTSGHTRRITPAYAGKSQISLFSGILIQGSPPPMRGKVLVGDFNLSTFRITPAYAGKRSMIEICIIRSRDHPRLCGEKLISNYEDGDVLGSPPPMRGKVSNVTLRNRTCRITPAYAGKR